MQYETWLKKIITAISEEYELPKEEAENIFRKNITQDIANKERRGIENGIFDNVKTALQKQVRI